MTTREWWYKAWRLIRVAKRESRLATLDMCVWGTGMLTIDKNGEVKRIPPLEFYTDIKKPGN